MANKERKLTTQGQTVKGALAAYLTPRLAADKAIKPGELDSALKKVSPGRYAKQIPGIVGTIKSMFGDRLAKDADLSDLPEILEALKAAGEELDEEGEDKLFKGKDEDADDGCAGKDDDDDDDEDEDEDEDEGHAGVKLMKMLSKYDIPSEDLEIINGLVTALGKGDKAKDEDADDKAKDEDEDEDNAVKGQKEVPQAMDGKKIIKIAEDRAVRRVQGLFQAAEDVKPWVGNLDALSFDSAEKIYRLALDSQKVDVKGVDPSAFRALVKMMPHPDTRPVAVVLDANGKSEYDKRYPIRPTKI